MKFRTEVHLPDSAIKMETGDRIFSMGSCFATEISDLLRTGQLQTLNNPYGTLFNPYSINLALQKIHDAESYTEENLVSYRDEVLSLDHHSSFNARFAHQTLEKINRNIEEANRFLQETNWVIITYGTSFIYKFLPKQSWVANCHKIPGKHFEKRLLTHAELVETVSATIRNLKDICKETVQILFTVSPVRHTKDGMVENMHSKAKLIAAVHEVLPQFENCCYLPVYEILMDDLRDYRFYKEDMIHPNKQAVQYLWEKFGNAYFSDELMDFVEENFKISKALEHKTSDDKSLKHLEFIENLKKRIARQQQKVKHEIFSFQ